MNFIQAAVYFLQTVDPDAASDSGRYCLPMSFCRTLGINGLMGHFKGRPKAALLFWFFRDFRCGVLFFIVILVIYRYRYR